MMVEGSWAGQHADAAAPINLVPFLFQHSLAHTSKRGGFLTWSSSKGYFQVVTWIRFKAPAMSKSQGDGPDPHKVAGEMTVCD